MAIAPQAAPQQPARTAALPPQPAATRGGYAVQVSSQRSEADAQASYRSLQSRYGAVLGGREAMIRRADLGEKGVHYRAQVGPFASADQATALCNDLKAAGGTCFIVKN
jgi:cell division septation protein DedD